MPHFGYTHYVAQGGGRGRRCHRRDGTAGPRRADQRHPHRPFVPGLAGGSFPKDTEEERAAVRPGAASSGRPASGTSSSRPARTRRSATPCWIHRSPSRAWMLDHDTDAYYKIASAFVEGKPSGGLTRDHILDNITTYWLTGTGASAARSYWENGQATARAAGQAPPPVEVPVGFTTFPGEIVATPRSWVGRRTQPSCLSTRSTRAAHSPPGRSLSCSPPRSAPRPVPPFGSRAILMSTAARRKRFS